MRTAIKALLGLGIAAFGTVHAAPRLFSVEDSRELTSALCKAKSGPTVIELVWSGRYRALVGPQPATNAKFHISQNACGTLGLEGGPGYIDNEVTIVGSDSILESFNFVVGDGASLTLLDMDLIDSRIENNGRLHLERASMTGKRIEVRGNSPHGIASVTNRGELTAINTSFARNTAAAPDLEHCIPAAGAIFNTGVAELRNSGFSDNAIHDPLMECGASDIVNSGGTVRLINTAIAGAGQSCRGSLTSLGHNATGFGCELDSQASDLQRDNLVLHDAAVVDRGGRITVSPTPGSILVDAGDDDGCEALDQRGFPRGTGRSGGCDIGPVELQADPAINPGTASALWFDPDNDGVYLQLTHLSPQRLLLAWLAFDAEGEPLWVYGTGKPEGDTVVVNLFVNRGIALNGGLVDGSVEAVTWGTATFDIQSCERARFSYVPDDPTIEPGAMKLRRLASVAGLICDDR